MNTIPKSTLVLGASENPVRYSHMAVRRLLQHGHPVTAVGRRAGYIHDTPIVTEIPAGMNFHSITLYLNPDNQKPWYEKILAAKPQRLIFNPGTENPELQAMAEKAGIECMEACTLVMLATAMY